MFEVAHDGAQPFIVDAGAGSVTVTGTRFDVRRRTAGMEVAVESGSVDVRGHSDAPRKAGAAVRLTAGLGATVDGSGAVAPAAPVDLSAALARRDGKLVFNDRPLSEVAAEVSRYRRQPVRVADAVAARLRVSSVFSADDPDALLAALPHFLPVAVRQLADGSAEIFRHRFRFCARASSSCRRRPLRRAVFSRTQPEQADVTPFQPIFPGARRGTMAAVAATLPAPWRRLRSRRPIARRPWRSISAPSRWPMPRPARPPDFHPALLCPRPVAGRQAPRYAAACRRRRSRSCSKAAASATSAAAATASCCSLRRRPAPRRTLARRLLLLRVQSTRAPCWHPWR